MPSFGVSSTFGVSAPTGYLQSSERSVDKEIATIKGADGKTAEAIPKPRSVTTVTLKTKGAAVLGTVGAGSMSGMTVTGAKYSETNDDFGTSEVTGTLYA
jgi:hypothetical protein